MNYWERIEGPMKSTKGSAYNERICWKIAEATLRGPKIDAHLAMPGTDWMRRGHDGIRRADLRAQLITNDHETILMSYDIAIIPNFAVEKMIGVCHAATCWQTKGLRTQ